MNGIFLFFHCSQQTGYAISTLKRRFQGMAENLVDDEGDIHLSYSRG